jgi:hypothetical protein
VKEVVTTTPELATMTYRDVHLRCLRPQRDDIKLQVYAKLLQHHAAVLLINMQDRPWCNDNTVSADSECPASARLQHNDSISRWLADSNKSAAITAGAISDSNSSVSDSDAQYSETSSFDSTTSASFLQAVFQK